MHFLLISVITSRKARTVGNSSFPRAPVYYSHADPVEIHRYDTVWFIIMGLLAFASVASAVPAAGWSAGDLSLLDPGSQGRNLYAPVPSIFL
jgi:hypothetical protein